MAQAVLITLREGLEMVLITVIVLAYLKRTRRTELFSKVFLGVGLAGIASLIAGVALFALGIELEGRTEEIFEGSVMLLAAVVLTWMIFWMKGQSASIRSGLEGQIEIAVNRGSASAIILIPFLAVSREGFETVLFIFSASKTASALSTTFGALVGFGVALGIGLLLYQGSHRVDLKSFFSGTGILLILFAAGLLTHGVHEFQELGYIPVLIEQVWDINNIVDERGTVGAFLKGLFGYNGNPSLLEIFVYVSYLTVTLVYFVKSGSNSRMDTMTST
jgi:high-affinity iron transporter